MSPYDFVCVGTPNWYGRTAPPVNTFIEEMINIKGKKAMVYQGPYYVLSKREGKKTVSKRLRVAEMEQAQKDVAEYKRFLGLCQEFERLTARLGELERIEEGLEQEKKRFKSLSSKMER
jgi:hypothetical protein